MATSVEEHEAKKWNALLSAVLGTSDGPRPQGSQTNDLPPEFRDLDADSVRAKIAVRKLQKLQRLVGNLPRSPRPPDKDFQQKLDSIPLPKKK